MAAWIWELTENLMLSHLFRKCMDREKQHRTPRQVAFNKSEYQYPGGKVITMAGGRNFTSLYKMLPLYKHKFSKIGHYLSFANAQYTRGLEIESYS